jgi:AcrR family transcriptional regulator
MCAPRKTSAANAGSSTPKAGLRHSAARQPPPAPRKAPRRTRERILELSLRLFNELGEPNVTTSAISEEMRISPGNLYYHFRNKDDIVNALFEQFEREIDQLLAEAGGHEPTVENAWRLLHVLFDMIWRYRFIYRDLNDLMSRNRKVEKQFQVIVQRKTDAARSLCLRLADAKQIDATPAAIESLATNMVVVATFWLSFEYVRNARRFSDADYRGGALARGVYQVMSLIGACLRGQAREQFDRLAAEHAEHAEHALPAAAKS